MDIQEFKQDFQTFLDYQEKKELALYRIESHVTAVGKRVAESDGYQLQDREVSIDHVGEQSSSVTFYYYGEDEYVEFPTRFLWSENLDADLFDRHREREEKKAREKQEKEARERERELRQLEALKAKYGES